MKITIPLSEVVSTGSLKDFYDDLVKIQSESIITNDGSNVYINNGNLILTISQVNSILVAGGEVEGYLMAVRCNIGLLDLDVVAGLPNRYTLDVAGSPENRKFKNWFDTSAELYLNDAKTQIYFLTNPVGTSISKYLTGSQIKLISQIPAQSIAIRLVSQFNTDIQTGWTKIDFS